MAVVYTTSSHVETIVASASIDCVIKSARTTPTVTNFAFREGDGPIIIVGPFYEPE